MVVNHKLSGDFHLGWVDMLLGADEDLLHGNGCPMEDRDRVSDKKCHVYNP